MKESIGATWILGLVMTFMILFIAVLAASLNYNKAFKIKNRLITMIEKEEGLNYVGTNPGLTTCANSSTDEYCQLKNEIKNYLANEGYSGKGKLRADQVLSCTDEDEECAKNAFNSICYISAEEMGLSNSINNDCSVYIQQFVAKREATDNSVNTTQTDPAVSNRITYRITTFFNYDIPILNISLKIPISGDTKTLFEYETNVDLIDEQTAEQNASQEMDIGGTPVTPEMLKWRDDTNGDGKVTDADEEVEHTYVDLMIADEGEGLGLSLSFSIAIVDTALKFWGSAGSGLTGILPF